MRVLLYTLGVLLLDQVTKLAVKGVSIPWLGIEHRGMEYGQSVPVLGEWFNITYVENPNMAFGIDIGGGVFLSVVSILASIGILIYLYTQRSAPFRLRLGLALILAGALGNLIDRVFYGALFGTAPLFQGHVVDFFDFDLFTINLGSGGFKFWPIFNIADAAVTVGVLTLLLFGGLRKTAVSPTRSANAEPVQHPADSGVNETAIPAEGNP